MATDESIVTKEWEPAAWEFVKQANPAQLHQIAAGTTLARHPLVSNPPGNSEQETATLRKLIAQEMKRHADFRGMVIRLLAHAGLVSAPGKEAKKEAKKETRKEAPVAAGKEATTGQERKPKKEK